MVCR